MKTPAIALLLLPLLLCACGQAGPLVLPDSQQPPPQEQSPNQDKNKDR